MPLARRRPADAAAGAPGSGTAGTAPAKIPRPASTASASTSSSSRRSTPRSIPAPSAPAPLMMPSGADIPQQCTTVGAAVAESTSRRPACASASSTGLTRFRPLALGTLPASTAGSEGSSTCSSSRAPGTRAATPDRCAATPSASDSVRSRTAPGSASTGSWLRASSRAGRHRPRPADLQLQRALVAVGRLFQRIQVPGQQRLRAAHVPARAVGEAPAPGGHVHRQVDQQPRGPADHVRAHAAVRELDQAGQVRELIEDEPHGRERVGAGHGAHAGGRLRWPRVGGGSRGILHVNELSVRVGAVQLTCRYGIRQQSAPHHAPKWCGADAPRERAGRSPRGSGRPCPLAPQPRPGWPPARPGPSGLAPGPGGSDVHVLPPGGGKSDVSPAADVEASHPAGPQAHLAGCLAGQRKMPFLPLDSPAHQDDGANGGARGEEIAMMPTMIATAMEVPFASGRGRRVSPPALLRLPGTGGRAGRAGVRTGRDCADAPTDPYCWSEPYGSCHPGDPNLSCQQEAYPGWRTA